MANINGLIGYNKSGAAINKLLAAYGNDVVDLSSGLGYSLNLNSANNVEFELFLDRVFFENYSETPKTFDGTAWTTQYASKMMLAKYIKLFRSKARLLLGNCAFPSIQAPQDASGNAITFPSRVFLSDLFFGNNLTWGIEWGRNGSVIGGTNIFQLDQASAPLIQDFVAANIKVGDPLFITNGNAQLTAAPYFVTSIENPYRLRVSTTFPVTATNLHFWVGSNWFDVATDNGDQITGFSDNSDRILVSKLLSLSFYTGSQLRQIKDAVGTSSQRSMINKNGYTYYFHGSQLRKIGIYRSDGVSSVKVSRAIDPYIRGMSSTNFPLVVAWEEGDDLRFFLGDVTNTVTGEVVSKAVATLNTTTNAWDVSPISDTPVAVTKYRVSGVEASYLGTDSARVLQMGIGNDFNGQPIRFRVETKVYYPQGTDILNYQKRVQIIGRKLTGIKVGYKLWDTPELVDDEFKGIGELKGDKTELPIPDSHNFSSGIQLLFEEQGILKNDAYIEKITFFYIPVTKRVIKQD